MDSPYLVKRNLIQIKPVTPQTPTRDLDLSIALTPNELHRMMNYSASAKKAFNSSRSYLDNTFNATATNLPLDLMSTTSSRSMLGAGYNSEYEQQRQTLLKEKTDFLYMEFFAQQLTLKNETQLFDMLKGYEQTCIAIWDEIKSELSRCLESKKSKYLEEALWLEQELKTWKLIFALYYERIVVQCNGNVEDSDMPPLCASEHEVVEQLYQNNSVLREYQNIVDWLEAIYEKQNYGPEITHTTDHAVGWENTLYQLKNKRETAFGNSGVEIVQSLDPDAPLREKRPLHALDEQDNLRLSKGIFQEIRRGCIDEAINLCKLCGQTWRAVILEGWRLHRDPNYENVQSILQKESIEGNPRRDIWKKIAWSMADSKKFDEYTRAIAGAYSGHLESLKGLSGNSWEDLLWSYLKVQIDIRVEEEIRNCCMKSYHPMPDAYWNSKMALEKIFNELSVHNDSAVREYASSRIGLIQKYLVLDDIPEMLQQMKSWLEPNVPINNTGTIALESESFKPLSAQMLRFLAHIVLFMRHIDRVDREENADCIVAAYVEELIKIGDPQLVAYYTSRLPSQAQVELYSKFLEGIHEKAKRKRAIEEALSAGLPIDHIITYTVDRIRQRVQSPSEAFKKERLAVGEISAFDEEKIHALEWLTFLPTQGGELLWQSNAMVRLFLAEGKSECVRQVMKTVPRGTLEQLFEQYGGHDNLPLRELCSEREHLSYSVYLSALDRFDEWTRLYHSRPKEPEVISSKANFTERIASEHKEQAYRCDLNRWNMNLEEQTKVTSDALYNVLLFPEKGWLIDPDNTEQGIEGVNDIDLKNRQIQLNNLRSICIPEIVLFLHKLHYLSKDYQSCVRLSEYIASEERKLYRVYTNHKLVELLTKLAESSLELLNHKYDPWGYVNTT